MLKKLRRLLFPFSLLYGLGTSARNRLYDSGKLHSVEFDLPVISIGNLSAGGTGKTPMTEYLIQLLSTGFQLGVLSRGYKRKTKGFLLASPESTAADIGDESMQLHEKFPEVTIAVAEIRVMGIPFMLQARPGIEVILLDDAYQHRAIKAGLQILLTDYTNLYTRDLLLPAGNLRESASGSSRADIIIVTKCNPEMTKDEKEKIAAELKPLPHQKLYFTKIRYGVPYHFISREALQPQHQEVMLVCGIANPSPFIKEAETTFRLEEKMTFSDHHAFSQSDIKNIVSRFEKLPPDRRVLLTTEKDAARLRKFEKDLRQLPLYVWPMEHEFLFNEGPLFDNQILLFCEGFHKAV
ncbi:MAG: tetraacyldisaccharide 4'-kinase [Chitinophagaceae bacterium]|nr:tetraacyldisaccharide 4'-kinase [Chitinophagaceae bacterium]